MTSLKQQATSTQSVKSSQKCEPDTKRLRLLLYRPNIHTQSHAILPKTESKRFQSEQAERQTAPKIEAQQYADQDSQKHDILQEIQKSAHCFDQV